MLWTSRWDPNQVGYVGYPWKLYLSDSLRSGSGFVDC